MPYSERAVLYSRIQSLTKLIAGGEYAKELRANPTLRQKRTIHFFDTHTLDQSKDLLAKLKEKHIKLLK